MCPPITPDINQPPDSQFFAWFMKQVSANPNASLFSIPRHLEPHVPCGCFTKLKEAVWRDTLIRVGDVFVHGCGAKYDREGNLTMPEDKTV